MKRRSAFLADAFPRHTTRRACLCHNPGQRRHRQRARPVERSGEQLPRGARRAHSGSKGARLRTNPPLGRGRYELGLFSNRHRAMVCPIASAAGQHIPIPRHCSAREGQHGRQPRQHQQQDGKQSPHTPILLPHQALGGRAENLLCRWFHHAWTSLDCQPCPIPRPHLYPGTLRRPLKPRAPGTPPWTLFSR